MALEVEVKVIPVIDEVDLSKLDSEQLGKLLSHLRQTLSTVRHDRHSELAAPVDGRIYEGRVARVHHEGDELNYSWGKEKRDADELKNIVEQLAGKPVTLNHPNGLIADGVEAHVIGEILSARVDGEFAIARFIITDDTALQEIDDGLRELSLGYACHVDSSGYQKGTRIDHLAVVARARCGEKCTLRTDHSERQSGCHCGGLCKSCAISNTHDHVSKSQSESGTDSAADSKDVIVTDELQKQLAAALADAAQQKARADQAEKERDEAINAKSVLDAELVNVKKDLESEKTRADQAESDAKASAEKARTDAAADTQAQIEAKVALISAVAPIIGKSKDREDGIGAADLAKMSDRDIKVAVIKHVDGDDVPADKADAYVDGVYEGALKRFARAGQSRIDAVVTLTQMRKDGINNPLATGFEAERKASEEMRNRMAGRTKDKE